MTHCIASLLHFSCCWVYTVLDGWDVIYMQSVLPILVNSFVNCDMYTTTVTTTIMMCPSKNSLKTFVVGLSLVQVLWSLILWWGSCFALFLLCVIHSCNIFFFIFYNFIYTHICVYIVLLLYSPHYLLWFTLFSFWSSYSPQLVPQRLHH